MEVDKGGRPDHEPTDANRRTIEAMSAGGIPQEDIARVIDIDPKTLRKHYRDELDTAATKANAKIAQTLYTKAINGDTTAAIWWTKARMQWSEKKTISGDDEAPIEHVIRWASDGKNEDS